MVDNYFDAQARPPSFLGMDEVFAKGRSRLQKSITRRDIIDGLNLTATALHLIRGPARLDIDASFLCFSVGILLLVKGSHGDAFRHGAYTIVSWFDRCF